VTATTTPVEAGTPGAAPVAYVMSRFPKLTETFILYEILAVEQLGQPVALFPLLHEHQPVKHPEAIELEARAHFQPFLSRDILASQWRALRHRPREQQRPALGTTQ